MPQCSARSGILVGDGRIFQLASVPATGKNFCGEGSTCSPADLTLRAWRKSWRPCKKPLLTLPWIWTCWIRLSFRHRNPGSRRRSFLDLLGAAHKVSGLNIVGCDVNELCPAYDQSGASTAVACKVLRELLLLLSR